MQDFRIKQVVVGLLLQLLCTPLRYEEANHASLALRSARERLFLRECMDGGALITGWQWLKLNISTG